MLLPNLALFAFTLFQQGGTSKESENNKKHNIIHLMSASEGNSKFCFHKSLNVYRDEVEFLKKHSYNT